MTLNLARQMQRAIRCFGVDRLATFTAIGGVGAGVATVAKASDTELFILFRDEATEVQIEDVRFMLGVLLR